MLQKKSCHYFSTVSLQISKVLHLQDGHELVGLKILDVMTEPIHSLFEIVSNNHCFEGG